MKIKSTLPFVVTTPKGKIEKTTLTKTPMVVDGILHDAPPAENDTLWLVNAAVFGASDRTDFIMFDPKQTIRNEEGKAVAQGGWVGRNSSGSF